MAPRDLRGVKNQGDEQTERRANPPDEAEAEPVEHEHANDGLHQVVRQGHAANGCEWREPALPERSTKEQRDSRDISSRLHERPDDEEIHQQREVRPRICRSAADNDHNDRVDDATADPYRQPPRGDAPQGRRMFGDTLEYATATDVEAEQKQPKVLQIRESLYALTYWRA